MSNAITSMALLAYNVQAAHLDTLAADLADSMPETANDLREAAASIGLLATEVRNRLRKSELDPEVRKFKKYSDGAHGWVAAKVDFLAELGILGDVSAHSYHKGATVYLEEDRDAGLLFAALNTLGQEYDVVDIFHEKKSPIRSYPSVVVGAKVEHDSLADANERAEQEATALEMSEGLPVPSDDVEPEPEPVAAEPEPVAEVQETARERKNRKDRERRAAKKAAAES